MREAALEKDRLKKEGKGMAGWNFSPLPTSADQKAPKCAYMGPKTTERLFKYMEDKMHDCHPHTLRGIKKNCDLNG